MHSSKICFKCKKTLPLTEFYKHPKMKDGHLGKCKECAKSDSTSRRKSKLEEVREYDRNRKNKEERFKYNIARTRKRRAEDSRYMKAHNDVYRALKKGVLVKTPCQYCGREDHVHGHHDDYDKPLSVMWLCPVCHRKRHDELSKLNKDVF